MKSPPSFIWGEGGAKNEGLLYLQSTIDIHILNMFRLTVDTHFQNTLLLPLSLLLCSPAATKLRRLALCAFIRHFERKNVEDLVKDGRWFVKFA